MAPTEKSTEQRKFAIIERVMKDNDIGLVNAIEHTILMHGNPEKIKEITCKLQELADTEWGKTKPTRFIFEDVSYAATSWRKVYVGIINILIKYDELNSSILPIPDYYRNTRYFANKEPLHPSGRTFTDPEKINDMYVECHYNTYTKMRNLIKVIKLGRKISIDEFEVTFLS